LPRKSGASPDLNIIARAQQSRLVQRNNRKNRMLASARVTCDN
jgi:hypothetical protein